MINLEGQVVINGQNYFESEIKDKELSEGIARQNKVLKVISWCDDLFGSQITQPVFTHQSIDEVARDCCNGIVNYTTVADFTNVYTEEELKADRREYKEIILNSLRKLKEEDIGTLRIKLTNLPKTLVRDILMDLL